MNYLGIQGRMPISNMEEEFNKLKNKYPDISTIVIFHRCLEYTTKRKLRQDFETFVDKDDYIPSIKEKIIKWLHKQRDKVEKT